MWSRRSVSATSSKILEVRIALENLAIENACMRMTEAQLEELWNAAKNFEATMAEGNLVKLAEADVIQ